MTLREEKSSDLRLPYLGLEHVESWTGIHSLADPGCAYDEMGTRLFRKGDILFGKLRPYLAKVARVDCSGRCSSEFLVLQPRSFEGRFLSYLLTSPEFVQQVNASTFGAKMPRANWECIGDILVSVPVFTTQCTIADFLDRKTVALDALIHKKLKLLDLVSEKQVAIINRAVTKGTAPGISLKWSGVPWIGEVPRHWTVTRAGRLCGRITKGATPANQATSWGHSFPVPFLRVENLSFNGELKIEELRFIAMATHRNELARSVVKPGDLLINLVGPPLGKVSRVTAQYSEWNINQAIAFFRPVAIQGEFLAYWLQTDFVKAWFVNNAKKTSGQANLTLEMCRELPVVLPPPDEQLAIALHCDSATQHHRQMAHVLNAQVAQLLTYRQALITAAVTGQLEIPPEPV